MLSSLFSFSLDFLLHLIPFPFRLGPKISGRDLLLVEECCNAPDSMRQVSSSYSSLLPCHLLACCIFAMSSSAFHLHVFKNLHPFGFPWFSPLSVSSPDTLSCTRCTFQFLFCEWEKNVLGMGRDFSSGLGISPVDLPSNYVPFGGRLMPQRLTA